MEGETVILLPIEATLTLNSTTFLHNDATTADAAPPQTSFSSILLPPCELRLSALRALAATEPADKIAQVRALHALASDPSLASGQPGFALDTERVLRVEDACPAADNAAESDKSAGRIADRAADAMANVMIPGRPAKPVLVPPLQVPRRTMRTAEGRAGLLHALCHIEFNAINLALDAIWRFAGMPLAYYTDWLQVAFEEAYHFSLLAEHLHTMGYAYGDFAGHDTLWEMVAKTSDDVLARMALVPRTMEARGLDAAPSTRNKLAQVGDHAGAAIIDIILRDEIGHVATGNRWYAYLCRQRGLEPVASYRALALRYSAPKCRAPFNLEARRAAGFTEEELAALQNVANETAVMKL